MDDKLAKEIGDSRYAVMVRGLPVHKDTKGNETKEQSWDRCDKLMYELRIENEVEVIRVKRYPRIKEKRSSHNEKRIPNSKQQKHALPGKGRGGEKRLDSRQRSINLG